MGHWGLQDRFAESTGFTVGASLLAKVVNDDADWLNTRGALALFASKLAPTGVTQRVIRALFYIVKSEFLRGSERSAPRSLDVVRVLRGTRESINTIYFNEFYARG
ncbi:hypothetical protein [Pseudomonas sp. AN3A02]|uniref:hypothetical protein n=1 Tax=Pseudomonas sp. AN3A02 TaxID=2719587 RepID=UPI00143117A2|nr:hypothetical protein [Pseudomonas sp. AN3A02]NIL17513.1 hypothetical protein [Pseudomonas sp. AN3A02]